MLSRPEGISYTGRSTESVNEAERACEASAPTPSNAIANAQTRTPIAANDLTSGPYPGRAPLTRSGVVLLSGLQIVLEHLEVFQVRRILFGLALGEDDRGRRSTLVDIGAALTEIPAALEPPTLGT